MHTVPVGSAGRADRSEEARSQRRKGTHHGGPVGCHLRRSCSCHCCVHGAHRSRGL